ncbi:zinc-binding dehydrogenase [Streptomyces sp. NPDC052292]|uniref:zinc-binding dehydrogenase n=1 Tax=Streptomyces sp. NPDC052292 TaxID=3155053 RepID=UPI003425CEBE
MPRAVGLSAVLAAKLLGVGRIIALSRHADRQAMAKDFGATDIVAERGDDAVMAMLRLTDGAGVDAALECVGTDQSIETTGGIVRAGDMIGAVGVPLLARGPASSDHDPGRGRPRPRRWSLRGSGGERCGAAGARGGPGRRSRRPARCAERTPSLGRGRAGGVLRPRRAGRG